MHHPQDDDPGIDYLEDDAIIAVEKMAIVRPKQFVLRNIRTTQGEDLKLPDLLFKMQNEGVSRSQCILGDIFPYLLNISFSNGGDLNLKFSWHF